MYDTNREIAFIIAVAIAGCILVIMLYKAGVSIRQSNLQEKEVIPSGSEVLFEVTNENLINCYYDGGQAVCEVVPPANFEF